MFVNFSAPPGPIVPVLTYEDVDRAIAWLCPAFGFTERLRTPPEPDGTIHHAQLAVGMGAVILTGQPGFKLHDSTQSLFVPVPDVDGHFDRARQCGARIVNPPKTCAFGERQYTAEDLAGYRWTFSQSVADVKPEDWGAQSREIASRLALLPRPRLCYLQIPAADVAQSVAFYEAVFGWNIRNRDSTHPSFDDATGYVSGAWIASRPAAREPGLLPYIWIDNIDATLTLAVAHGGEIVEPPLADSPGGTSLIATFRDPAGNVIGLYQEGSSPA